MKTAIRIILSPFIFLWGYFLLAAGSILFIPIGFMVIVSFVGLLAAPFVWLLQKGGSTIEGPEPFLDEFGYLLGHFLGATVYIWVPFWIVYNYIKTGEIFTGD